MKKLHLICLVALIGFFSKTLLAQTVNMGSVRTITSCSAMVYDNGGTGYYSNSHSDTLTIYPTNPGSKITITLLEEFISIDDTLFIYNSQYADPLKVLNVGSHGYPFTNSSNPITLNWSTTATDDNLSGAITLRFKSNESTNNFGYKFSVIVTQTQTVKQ